MREEDKKEFMELLSVQATVRNRIRERLEKTRETIKDGDLIKAEHLIELYDAMNYILSVNIYKSNATPEEESRKLEQTEEVASITKSITKADIIVELGQLRDMITKELKLKPYQFHSFFEKIAKIMHKVTKMEGT